ncbi:MAG: hypothetical protein ABI281_02860 [Caldimonas sp.]
MTATPPPMETKSTPLSIPVSADARPAIDAITAAQGRQILFYSPVGLLGGTLTCSRCGASGRQPDVIEHDHGCSYARRPRDG